MTDVFESLLFRFAAIREREPVADLVNSFFEDKGRGYVVAILAAPDDAAAERITRSWATNWLVDEVRKLPFGLLRNRLEKRLTRSDLFEPSAVAHHWYLVDEEDEDRPATTSQLLAVAAATEITISDAGTLGNAGELEELLRRLLDLAGRLHVAEMTVICGNRFPSTLQVGDPSQSTADVDWHVVEDTTEGANSIFVAAVKMRAERAANALLPELTPEELVVLRHYGDVPRLAQELNCSRSSAYTSRSRLRGRLMSLTEDRADARETLAALIRLVLDDSQSVPSTKIDRETIRAI